MFLIAGPCAIENREMVMQTAAVLKDVCERLGVKLYFKSSFDKANRTSPSERGIGMEKGLAILREVQESFLIKDEDVLLLTFPKSGKEAGSDTDRLWLRPSFIQHTGGTLSVCRQCIRGIDMCTDTADAQRKGLSQAVTQSAECSERVIKGIGGNHGNEAQGRFSCL